MKVGRVLPKERMSISKRYFVKQSSVSADSIRMP